MKPDKPFKWAYGAGAVKTDPAGKEEDGYTKEILPHAYLNHHLNKIGEWTEYLDMLTKTYYVDATNGNDSNPGTYDEPFQTLTHALDLMETRASNVTINLFNGNYFIHKDYSFNGVNLIIQRITSINDVTLQFVDKLDGNKNKYYGFDLVASNLKIAVKNLTTRIASDTSKGYDTLAGCIRIHDSSQVSLIAENITINGDNTPNEYPALIIAKFDTAFTMALPRISVLGAVNNNKGYLLNSLGLVCLLNAAPLLTTFTDSDKIVSNHSQNLVKPTTMTATVAPSDSITLEARGQAKTINYNDSAGTVTTKLQDFLYDTYGITKASTAGNIAVVSNKIVSANVAITGKDANTIIGDIKCAGDTTTYFNVKQGKYQENFNILTNIGALK